MVTRGTRACAMWNQTSGQLEHWKPIVVLLPCMKLVVVTSKALRTYGIGLPCVKVVWDGCCTPRLEQFVGGMRENKKRKGRREEKRNRKIKKIRKREGKKGKGKIERKEKKGKEKRR